MVYKHEIVEKKWRTIWEKYHLYKATDFDKREKKYILAEFPYPSGSKLHVGHCFRYTMPDIYSRVLRMKGYNVLFPIGWDAFGLPTENYAIKTGENPKDTTKKNIGIYREQLKMMGYSFDWNREVNTTDPNYYKWTQWIFLKLYENGLAQLKEEPVWWCEDLKTVLANEEVLDGPDGEKISERGGKRVERRMMKQWVLKITEYADKLIEGLYTVDYPKSIIDAQINWIGKSNGARVRFLTDETGIPIEIFTTRVDTIFGATFIALSPEYPDIEKFIKEDYKSKVGEYITKAKNKTEVERMQNKEKTGEFTGSYAINPFNEGKIPIYIADFILPGYGTGAIMGVPAHDSRDYEFATKFNIPIKRVINPIGQESSQQMPFENEGILINSQGYNGKTSHDAGEEMLQWIEDTKIGKRETNYKLRDWIFSRQRYWGEPIPLIHKKNGEIEEVEEKELPLELPDIEDYKPTSDGLSPLAKIKDWVEIKDENNKIIGLRETNTMPNWAGSCWYYLRYIDPKNDKEIASKKLMDYWLPVDKYFGGGEHTTLHLLYSRFWHRFLYDIGVVNTQEPYKFRRNTGLVLGPDGQKMSKSIGNVINPDQEIEKYGADALRIYICFIGPYDGTVTWQEAGLAACRKLVEDIYTIHKKVSDIADDHKIKESINIMVKNITDDIEIFHMNTAISEIMIFINLLKKETKVSKDTWKIFLRCIAPFAPFITEELWQDINGNKEWTEGNSIHLQPYPEYDPKLESKQITIPIQINGKFRGVIEIQRGESEEEIKKQIYNNRKVSDYLENKDIKNFIIVKDKIVNIII